MKKVLLFVFAVLVTTSCRENQPLNNRVVVAKVGEKYLYHDEIPALFNNSLSREDSISIVRNYIDRWIKKELVLGRAGENLSVEYISEIDQKLDETRANLMIYQYEQQMMLQRMDTIVGNSQIESYYNDNIARFNLSSSLVKAQFIKIPVEAPNIDRVQRWYRSDSQEDLQSLESYCYQFAEKYDDFGEEWIRVIYLLRELPEDIGDAERFIRNNRFYQTSDSSFHYFVNIRDYRLKGSVSPIEFVEDDIRNVILNNRKLEFLKDLENGIYNEALKLNAFKIY
ncbi:MAG TPA: hypothetical protein VMW76_01565 [Bacteroidales bacterium]|nr:hypothetical protein [Bacteroidales bacterium]